MAGRKARAPASTTEVAAREARVICQSVRHDLEQRGFEVAER